MGKAVRRWVAADEQAFLAALAATGEVTAAASAIGRSRHDCAQRRKYSPDLATGWDQVMATARAERIAAGRATTPAGDPSPGRARHDGWTAERRRVYLRVLAETCSMGEAAARVGLTTTSATRLRARCPAFKEACDRALTDGAPTAAEAMRQRAVDGWEEPIFHAGKQVGVRRVRSDTLLKEVVAREAAVGGGGPTVRYPTPEETNASILRKLAALSRATEKERRAAELAWCERMEKAGWAP